MVGKSIFNGVSLLEIEISKSAAAASKDRLHAWKSSMKEDGRAANRWVHKSSANATQTVFDEALPQQAPATCVQDTLSILRIFGREFGSVCVTLSRQAYRGGATVRQPQLLSNGPHFSLRNCRPKLTSWMVRPPASMVGQDPRSWTGPWRPGPCSVILLMPGY